MKVLPDEGWIYGQNQTLKKLDHSGTTESLTLNLAGEEKRVVVVTVRGAKTRQPRRIPLMRVEHDGEYAVVASLGGAPKNPVWYYNIVANPRVELQDGAVTKDYDSRAVFGDEKAVWWERAVAAWPDYAEYQAKTDRQIPVFVLTPVS